MQAKGPQQQEIKDFQRLKAEVNGIMRKIGEFESQRDEHALVIKALSDMKPERRCYRMVGGVLVERTVGEVLPVITANHTSLSTLVVNLEKQITERNVKINAFVQKYGPGPGGDEEEEAQPQPKKEVKAGGGVLVGGAKK